MPPQTISTASGNKLQITTGDKASAIEIGNGHVGDLTFGYSGNRTGVMRIGGSGSTGAMSITNGGEIDVNATSNSLFLRSSGTTELRGGALRLGVSSATGAIDMGTDAARTTDVTIGNTNNSANVNIRAGGSVTMETAGAKLEAGVSDVIIEGSSIGIGASGATDPTIQIGPVSGVGTAEISVGHFSSSKPVNVRTGGTATILGVAGLDINTSAGGGAVGIGGTADVTIGDSTIASDINITTAGTLALENTHASNGIELKTDTTTCGVNGVDTTTVTTLGGRLELVAGGSGINSIGVGDSGVIFIGGTNTRTNDITIGHQDNRSISNVYGQNVELRGKSGTTIGHPISGDIDIGNESTRTANVNIGNASASGDVNIDSADRITLARAGTSIAVTSTLAMEGDTGINIGLNTSDTGPIRFGGGNASSRNINFFTGGTLNQVGATTSIRCDGGAIEIRGDNGTEDIEIASDAGTTSSVIRIGNAATRTGIISIGHSSAAGNVSIRSGTIASLRGGFSTVIGDDAAGTVEIGNSPVRTADVNIGNASSSGDVNIDSAGTVSIHGLDMSPNTATFTPTLVGTDSGIYSMSVQTGRVVYYGAMMHISVHIEYGTGGDPAGSLQFNNLPTFSTEDDQIYRFTVGNMTAYNKAATEMIEIKHTGTNSARAWRNGSPVTIASMDATGTVNFSGWLVRG